MSLGYFTSGLFYLYMGLFEATEDRPHSRRGFCGNGVQYPSRPCDAGAFVGMSKVGLN
jgi:hypothetical protein